MNDTIVFAGQLYNEMIIKSLSPPPELYNIANVGNVLPAKQTKEGVKYFILSEE